MEIESRNCNFDSGTKPVDSHAHSKGKSLQLPDGQQYLLLFHSVGHREPNPFLQTP
jgi:hypothetical protein